MSNLNFEEAINNLSNDDVKVRKEAIESLVGITDEEAIEPLIKATTDDNAQVRFKAAEILGSMGDVAVCCRRSIGGLCSSEEGSS